jgi:cation diffusion facilitator CzcD-associated flavoprotein CzcO
VRLRTDVLIIGAGPAGLTLAALLAVHGVDLQILDSKSGPVGQSRAALVQCSVMSLKSRAPRSTRHRLPCSSSPSGRGEIRPLGGLDEAVLEGAGRCLGA